ncbi:MAG: hypothetical protein AAGI52_04105 [Bacteroidota bacterium]
MFDDRSAYPHPDEFKVVRPTYSDQEILDEEGNPIETDVPEAEGDEIVASIVIEAHRVVGRSVTRPGARRAALYEAAKTYRNYHPSFRIGSPFPDEFEDAEGTKWTRVPTSKRQKLGDYTFLLDGEDEEDSADIEQMLAWDVRPEPVYDEEDED